MAPLNFRTDRVAFLGLLALLALAPFERLQPLLVLPGQSLTNLEIVALMAFLLWLAARWRLGPGGLAVPGLLPLALLLAVFVLSSLLAASQPAAAFRFTGRLVLGTAVYAMVVTQMDSLSRIRLAILVLVASGSVVACLGILEYWDAGSVQELLGLFRPGGFYVAGRTRVASTLQYPTITSMYLELTLAWGLALLLGKKPTGTRCAWVFAALVLMGTAIQLTMTRAGVLTVLVMLGLAVAVAVRRGRRSETKSLLLLLVVLGIVFVSVLAYTDLGVRLRSPDEATWYRAEYRVPPRLSLEAGTLNEVQVSVRNQGLVGWTREPANPVRLGYHWLNEDGSETVVFEGARTDLSGEVAPGQWTTLGARVFAPPEPGSYRLVWDLLKEHRFWFSMLGVETVTTVVEVTPAHGPVRSLPPATQLPLPRPRFSISRWELWQVALKMIGERPWLGIGPDNFRLTYGSRIGVADADRSYHAHNLFLEILVSTGVVGGGLFLWMLYRLLGRLERLGRRKEHRDFSLYVGGSAAMAAILVHGLVDYFLEFTPLIVVIWASFGLIVVAERISREHS